MDAQDNEPSTPKIEGEDAAKPRRGRPPKDRETLTTPDGQQKAMAYIPPPEVMSIDRQPTIWIKARRKLHIAPCDMPGSEPDAASKKVKEGEPVEVFAKAAKGLIEGKLADAV